MSHNAIAIVGMSCRFPGAADPETFWSNLARGVESIRRFSRAELLAAGLPPALIDRPEFVSAHGALDGVELFDAEFFGYSQGEAALIDPQQRLFMECAWEALERGGFVPRDEGPVIGVFAGAGVNAYLIRNVASSMDFDDPGAVYNAILGGDKDFLTTRIAYKFGLGGPAMTVQAACATSLVAVHSACQSLLNGECDLALAGGVSLRIPQASGYLFVDGGIHSADGTCRAFDAQARGTVGGSGAGAVVLKRLEDALRDGDTIEAVILGTAVNNDGAHKVSFTAPGVRGQASVVSEARAVAGIAPRSLGYSEMHGTATALGDPIEVAAVRESLGKDWSPEWRCYIGSVKTNIGHLDAAAGIAGLIKTVLALKDGTVPPSLHFDRPNPKIDFASGPLRVATQPTPWPANGSVRRASVSSFGLGGVNAHAVLEQAPDPPARQSRDAWRLFTLSAKTPQALAAMRTRLADHLDAHPQARPEDIACTLATGRRQFAHATFVVARSAETLRAALRAEGTAQGERPETPPRIAFLFPGQGAQQVGSGRELHRSEAVYREAFDACADALVAAGAPDVRALVLREPSAEAERELRRTLNAQPALFAVSYALTALWRSWGVIPEAVLGHSSGEYAAAVCAGLMSLEDAGRALAARARLMDRLPAGVMAAVGLGEEELAGLLPEGLHIAAVNAPALCTVAGTDASLQAFEKQVAGRQVFVHRLQTAHAFHSPAVDPVLDEFRAALSGISLSTPSMAFYSAVVGAAANPERDSWVQQIRRPVLFGPALQAMLAAGITTFVELGPGTTLAGLARQAKSPRAAIFPGLAKADEARGLLTTLGHLWLAGVNVDWAGVLAQDDATRIVLPTYPFMRKRHWIGAMARRTTPRVANAIVGSPGTELEFAL